MIRPQNGSAPIKLSPQLLLSKLFFFKEAKEKPLYIRIHLINGLHEITSSFKVTKLFCTAIYNSAIQARAYDAHFLTSFIRMEWVKWYNRVGSSMNAKTLCITTLSIMTKFATLRVTLSSTFSIHF